jgi:hypothetical protein
MDAVRGLIIGCVLSVAVWALVAASAWLLIRSSLPPRRSTGSGMTEQSLPEQTYSETELSRQIGRFEAAIGELYAARAGQLIDGRDGYGWCISCGRNPVNAAAGWDTCGSCSN